MVSGYVGNVRIKVIFLDIDGGLDHYKATYIDNRCLNLVKYIVHRTGAKLVLSSSWKEVVLYPQCCNEIDREFINHLLVHSGLPFIGTTPDIDEERRELEILQWLNNTHHEVESFVILDDLTFGFLEVFPNQFVQTSGFLKNGLTFRQARKAIKILNNSKKPFSNFKIK